MLRRIEAKSILNKKKKRDPWFLEDYTLNPYTGCSINCIYCYTKGSKYGGRGELAYKVNAPLLLSRELERESKKGEYGYILLSSATDPYIKEEIELGLTRKLFEIIENFKFPVHILTKSTLVRRDFDLLARIRNRAILPDDLKGKDLDGVILNISISTMDEELSKKIEPGAPSVDERLKLLKEASREGFFVGVSFIPVLPYLSDSERELRKMIRTAKEKGAKFVFVGGLTLTGDSTDLFKNPFIKFIEKHYPHLLDNYLKMYKRGYPPRSYEKKLNYIAGNIAKEIGIRYKLL